eukprot:scaffold94669_cov62-Phaeocystis_antarctica.AAC.4
MPSFWSFFGFVGSLHLSSARVRTSGRDLLLLRCSPRFCSLSEVGPACGSRLIGLPPPGIRYRAVGHNECLQRSV